MICSHKYVHNFITFDQYYILQGIICAVGHWGMYTSRIGYFIINSKYFENAFFSEWLIPKQHLIVFSENGGAL